MPRIINVGPIKNKIRLKRSTWKWSKKKENFRIRIVREAIEIEKLRIYIRCKNKLTMLLL